MSKIRINDLARELEVKSKAILDVLPRGRSHREEDPLQFPRGPRSGESARAFPRHARSAGSAPVCAPASREADEIKTKIDLSHISKPGDVLKAITQQAASSAAATAPPPQPLLRRWKRKPAAPLRGSGASRSTRCASRRRLRAPAAAPRFITPQSAPPAPLPSVRPPRSAGSAPRRSSSRHQPSPQPHHRQQLQRSAAPAATSRQLLRRPTAPLQRRRRRRPAPPAPDRSAGRSAPAAPAATAAPPPRMIVPQTGPRPVYKAPPRPATAVQRRQDAPPGARRVRSRDVPCRDSRFSSVRGQARRRAPRPPLRPGERRPMHPTRQSPPARVHWELVLELCLQGRNAAG